MSVKWILLKFFSRNVAEQGMMIPQLKAVLQTSKKKKEMQGKHKELGNTHCSAACLHVLTEKSSVCIRLSPFVCCYISESNFGNTCFTKLGD